MSGWKTRPIQAQCLLVLMGATADGVKELIAVMDGYRESEQSWSELLLDLQATRVDAAHRSWPSVTSPRLLGRLRKIFPETKEQRCWVHKTANVLNKLPKSVQPKPRATCTKSGRPRRATANQAFDTFLEKYAAKYDKAPANA